MPTALATCGKLRMRTFYGRLDAAAALTADAELFNQCLITFHVGTLEIIEQLPALRHELQKAAPRMIVFDMGLEMFGEIVDPL